MNKTEFIKAIAEKSGLTIADSKKAVDAYSEVVTAALKGNDKVALIGFGSFSVKENPAREGVNPATARRSRSQPRKLLSLRQVQS